VFLLDENFLCHKYHPAKAAARNNTGMLTPSPTWSGTFELDEDLLSSDSDDVLGAGFGNVTLEVPKLCDVLSNR